MLFHSIVGWNEGENVAPNGRECEKIGYDSPILENTAQQWKTKFFQSISVKFGFLLDFK